MSRAPILPTLAVAAVILIPDISARSISAQPSTPSLVTLIARYADGRQDEAVRDAAAVADLGPLRLKYVQDVTAWIQSDPAQAVHRRAAAAAFLLELTGARLETDWGRLSDLVEFTCAGLRNSSPTPFELAWHRASIALAGRARARAWLLGPYARLPHQQPRRTPVPPSKNGDESPRHLMHGLERFPDDPQLRLARIVTWTWGRDAEPIRNMRRRNPDGYDYRDMPQREAIVALRPLVDDPLVGPEALVRIGQVHFTMNEHADAIDALKHAQARQASAPIRYLSFFIAGRVFEAMDKPDEAAAQYAKALEVAPGAESATIALGSLEFVRDRRDDAITRLAGLSTGPGTATDPGRLVGYGSFMHWPALVKALRAELPR